jgi:hypothetical protein
MATTRAWIVTGDADGLLYVVVFVCIISVHTNGGRTGECPVMAAGRCARWWSNPWSSSAVLIDVEMCCPQLQLTPAQIRLW